MLMHDCRSKGRNAGFAFHASCTNKNFIMIEQVRPQFMGSVVIVFSESIKTS